MSNSFEKQSQNLRVSVIEGITVNIIPNSQYEFLLSTAEVANGYGVSKSVIRDHQRLHSDELIQGKHFIKGVDFIDTLPKGSQPNAVYWTKAGIVRLGFFIKSERAKLFRDNIENLVLSEVEKRTDLFGNVEPVKKFPVKRKHNRLTPERLVEALSLTAYINDEEKRVRMVNILTGGTNYGTI